MTTPPPPPGFLSEEKFLKYFDEIKNLPKNPDQLAHRLKVMYVEPQTLDEILTMTPNSKGRQIIKSTDDKRYKWAEKIKHYFFDILCTNRFKYLALFYRAYFKVPENLTPPFTIHDDIILQPNTLSLQRHDASRRVIRNLFHLELLDETTITNSVKSGVPFWRSLTNLYNNFTLEDRFFATSSIEQCLQPKSPTQPINYNTLFYLFQAFQPKASILNPYLIWWVWNKPLLPSSPSPPPKKIFTPVMSWGSYLLAFLQSSPENFSEYVGIDVMPSVIKKCRKMAHALDEKRMPTLFLCPSEKIAQRYPAAFGQKGKYKNYFDICIICPPYFNMEIYPDGDQSTTLYPTYELWLEQYWRPTAALMFHTTTKTSQTFLIINDYTSLDGQHYPLTRDLTKIMCEEKFKHHDTYYLANRVSPLRVNKKDRLERMLVFTH